MKILIAFLLIGIININELPAQCSSIRNASTAELCLAASGIPFVFATYRLSPQYGLAENEQLGHGHIFGGELTWFPF